ncbi:NnrS family protein [Seohaeicola saemankumensis]|uniref:NnrS family protein n=1 Tax=Seohaeicola saemankumensis TaxID=481181 RepID=UPI001E5CC92C|nr:NnrS family protein [Seohaeicola saemankumensis]MCD1625676.1 NnrS family protein [Seohaeicola saemankumensis]
MAQTSAEQMRAWTGPALFSFGFRPFFLFGAVWVVVAMLLWLPALTGAIALPTQFDPVSWHAHEFLFGYLGAVLAGFLLTAVPNWTGRLPMVGWTLAALFGLWVAGRVAILISAILPASVAPAVDLAFPLVLGAMILREIVAGKNWKNLIVLALLAVFTLANALFHVEALQGGFAARGQGLRLGVATAVMMIAVIGGRIIPSFTRNWLARGQTPARPAPPMQRFDKLVLMASVPALLFWVVRPFDAFTGVLLVGLGVLHVVRLIRWQWQHTLREPLVWVLHLSYAFIPLGALLVGTELLLGSTATAAAQHLWMTGAIGGMTLAVMTRATLGHTGRALTANRATVVIYLCLFAAVAARLATPALPVLGYVSGILWLAAFGGFTYAYGPMLMRRKPETRK